MPIKEKRDIFSFIARVGAALGIAILLNQFPFLYLQALISDTFFRLKPAGQVSGHVMTVAIDRPTAFTLGREADALDHAQVINAIAKDNPAGILFVMDPLQIKGKPEAIQDMVKAGSSAPNFFVAINNIFLPGQEAEMQLPKPWENIPVASGPTTADKLSFAGDGVTRRLLIAYEGKMVIHAVMAQMFNKIISPKDYRGNFLFEGADEALIDYHPAGTFRPVSFIDILEKRTPPGTFTGKIVVIGRDTQKEATDYVRTPYSREIDGMSKVELHANMLDTLIRNSAPKTAPKALSFILTLIVSILTATIVWKVRPSKGILILFSTLFGLYALGWILMVGFGIQIIISHAMLAVLICYYFFIPYRLIVENRKSWEYQEKNKLLTQVEELKTNFLSMMSHDLKTPLARIQGMADLALHDGNQLSAQQKKALETITRSTEELGEFVNSVLNLTRVEGQQINLHLQSKDVNALLEEVIKKYEFMAQQKNIQIVSEMEPLFSIKIDVDLMRQVFSNLVENAIKYSAPGSRVMITTEEVDGHILVQVADQGLGIPKEDQSNIFMKFYRSSEVKNTPIKGSGLGLYLAKYFVELHNGTISVESEPKQGSTFTVDLPMEQ